MCAIYQAPLCFDADFHGLPIENLSKAAFQLKNNKTLSFTQVLVEIKILYTNTISNQFYILFLPYIKNWGILFGGMEEECFLLQIHAPWIHLNEWAVRVMTQKIRTKHKLSYE